MTPLAVVGIGLQSRGAEPRLLQGDLDTGEHQFKKKKKMACDLTLQHLLKTIFV